jgi:hypothetical protein
MLKPWEIRVLREAVGTGKRGGWHRDHAWWSDNVKVWAHRSGTEKVILQLDGGAYSTVRILMRDDVGEHWTQHAECRFRSSLSLILILVAYRLVDRRHGVDYQVGRADALADARKAVDRVW